MLRQTMLGSLAAVLLAPAALVAGVAAPAAAEPERHWEWGSLSADSGKLRRGCRPYRYSWALQPPEGDWAIELFLTDRDGKKLGTAVQLTGVDPLVGSETFTICKAATRPGRFLIRGLLSVQNGPDEYAEGWVKPALFKLRRR